MYFEWRNFLIQFIEEYSQFFYHCNWWYEYRAIHLFFENDENMGTAEVVFVFMGLGFRLAYCYNDETEARKQILKDIENLK